jgi:hypothetical protein
VAGAFVGGQVGAGAAVHEGKARGCDEDAGGDRRAFGAGGGLVALGQRERMASKPPQVVQA